LPVDRLNKPIKRSITLKIAKSIRILTDLTQRNEQLLLNPELLDPEPIKPHAAIEHLHCVLFGDLALGVLLHKGLQVISTREEDQHGGVLELVLDLVEVLDLGQVVGFFCVVAEQFDGVFLLAKETLGGVEHIRKILGNTDVVAPI